MPIRCRALLVFTLIVASAACHDPDKYQLLSVTNPDGTVPSTLLDVVPLATSIPANGGSRTRIEARIDPSSTVRTVSFETTAGILFAGSKNSRTTPVLDVAVDTNGVAAAELQSDTTPGTARVTVKIGVPNRTPAQFLAQAVDITFSPINATEVLTLVASQSTGEADGATLIRLVATVAPEIPTANRTVTFKATGGKFATNTGSDDKIATVVADASHTASVDLIAPLVASTVSITATVSSDNFSARTSITYSRAAPDLVFVEFDKGSVLLVNETSKITVTLLRNIGQVADNTVVTYSAKDSTGKGIGGFEKVTLAKVEANDGTTPSRVIATADFNPDDTAAIGVATVTATVGSRSGSATITLK